VEREKWVPNPPNVDPAGYFFRGDTLAELARNISNPYQRVAMAASVLQETVTRYNSFVDTGNDSDFGKPVPKYKIQTPPFYAAWATPGLHDSISGIRIDAKAQVIDLAGQPIPRLYAAGESAGGIGIHGQAKCIVFGRLAGIHAASENPEPPDRGLMR
jgi:succinate dehydrogenase/fumarate reductase flavoprotein subunit